jgi:hypothetical protein
MYFLVGFLCVMSRTCSVNGRLVGHHFFGEVYWVWGVLGLYMGCSLS